MGIGGAPGKTLKTPGSSGVRHRSARLGMEAKIPEKKKQNPRQQRSLVKPEFFLQHPSLSLSGCRSSTRLPRPGTRCRGRGQGRAEGVAFSTVAGGASRAAGREQSRLHDCPPPLLVRLPDAETPGNDWEPFQEPLAISLRGETLIPEGEVSFWS